MTRADRVLYVDDDPAYLELVATQLERLAPDVAVETEADPDLVASDLDRLADVACVITDYDMPGIDGIDLLGRVRAAHPQLPVILYTAQGSESVASEAISAQVTDYLRKDSGSDHYELLANRVRTAIDHYRARQRVGEVNRKQRRILGRITDRFVAVDSDWTITEINEKGAEGYPASPAELVGENYLELAEASDATESNPFLAAYKEAMETQEAATIVAESEVDPGTWLEVRAYPSTDGLSMFGRDVTDRKRRERRLRELQEATTRLDRCESREAVFETTVEMAAQVLELDMCVLAMARDDYLVPVATSAELPEGGARDIPVEEGLAGKTYRTGEGSLVDDVQEVPEAEPRGDYRSAISLPVGDAGNFQAVSEERGGFDETDYELARLLVDHVASALERVDREEQLRQQNDLLDEFASMASHDLKNGLNVARGRLDLAEAVADVEAAASEFDDARAALSRLEASVDDMLEYARQGQPVTEVAYVSLADPVRAAWEVVDDDGASLEVAAEGRIEADPDRLRQLFENLFRNAVEHAGPRVRVRVGALDRGGFYVADDGPGIDAPAPEQVFDRGYTTADTGTGYGLSIVREIAEAHGWDVAIADSAVGGARIEVETGVAI